MSDDPVSGDVSSPRLVTISLSDVTSDAAVAITAGGTRGVVARSDWFAAIPQRVGDVVVALQLTDGDRPMFSVAHPDMLTALFEGVSPEIRSGVVRVMGVARVPGVRAKVAVASTDATVDPIMACVGRDANRVRHVGLLTRGERIDVVAWHRDRARFLANGFAPASASKVTIDEDAATVAVPAHQMSAAVGRAGLNSQLAGRLVGVAVTVVAV